MGMNLKFPSPPFIYFIKKFDPRPGSSKIYSDPLFEKMNALLVYVFHFILFEFLVPILENSLLLHKAVHDVRNYDD